MDLADLARRLRTRTLAHAVTSRDEITSTRDLARELLDCGMLRPGELVIADRQTAGRGTPGKSFISDTPHGVWMTLALPGPPREGITLRAGAALVDTLRGDFNLEAHLKWPNDVLVGRLKIAGLIAEGVCGTGGRPWCLLSAGINIAQAGFKGTPLDGIACSLHMAGGRASREEVLAAYLNRLDPALDSSEALTAVFAARSRMPGRAVRITERAAETPAAGAREREVLVLGLDDAGALLVRGEHGPERWVGSTNRDIAADYAG